MSNDNMPSERTILRCPSDYDRNRSRMADYMRWLTHQGIGPFDDYDALHQWSIHDIGRFWSTIWSYMDIRASRAYDAPVHADGPIEQTQWFPGVRLNFAENLLREALTGRRKRVALSALNESGQSVQLTFGELHDRVAGLQSHLKAAGVTVGDRVVGYVANTPEAVIAMLAVTGLGAIWSSASPDFGVSGVVDRFQQIEPKVLITVLGYRYNGQWFDRTGHVGDIIEALDTLVDVVWVEDDEPRGALPVDSGRIPLTAWQDACVPAPGQAVVFEQLPFDHPVYILFSSGTTGAPKCIVHCAGGVLIQHAKELALHCDLHAGEKLFYFTTTGWMMWNWLVSGLMLGAEVILYDGSPGTPDLSHLWRLVDAHQITHFGTSAKFIGSCRNRGLVLRDDYDLSSLRYIFSTGSPLLPEDFDYVYTDIKSDVILASISGGTDIVSLFVGPCPLLPVTRGDIQCAQLGMDVTAYNDNGQAVVDQRGELVCRQAAPSMPTGFWNDTDGERYQRAYFSQFPGVWAHGDFIQFHTDGSCRILGRSDATLNPGGIRIGTAEIYRQVETLPEIAESIVAGQDWQGDTRIVLLVVMNDSFELTDDLIERIKHDIRTGATPRHVPARIAAISAIPVTRSGKKVEIAVSRLLSGQSVDNRDSLANREILDEIGAIDSLFEAVS